MDLSYLSLSISRQLIGPINLILSSHVARLKPAPRRVGGCPLARALQDTRSEGAGCLERTEVPEAAQRFERRPAAPAPCPAPRATTAAARASAPAPAPSPASAHVGGHLPVERLGGAARPERI